MENGQHWNSASESSQSYLSKQFEPKERQRQTDAMKYYIFCMKNRKSNKIMFLAAVSPSAPLAALLNFLCCRFGAFCWFTLTCVVFVFFFWFRSVRELHAVGARCPENTLVISTISFFFFLRCCSAQRRLSDNAGFSFFNFFCFQRFSRRDFFYSRKSLFILFAAMGLDSNSQLGGSSEVHASR